MSIIQSACQEVSGFSSKFSKAGLTAIGTPAIFINCASTIEKFSRKYFGLKELDVASSLRYSRALCFVYYPIKAVQLAQNSMRAYGKGDYLGFITSAISSVNKSISISQLPSKIIGSYHLTSLVESIINSKNPAFITGQAFFESLFAFKKDLVFALMLIGYFEPLLLYCQILMCDDQAARASFLSKYLMPDIQSLPTKESAASFADQFTESERKRSIGIYNELSPFEKHKGSISEIQKVGFVYKREGRMNALKRALGADALEHLNYRDLDKLDSEIKKSICSHAIAVSLFALGWFFSAGNALMFIEVLQDLQTLVQSISRTSRLVLQSPYKNAKEYDQYLFATGVYVLGLATVAFNLIDQSSTYLRMIPILCLLFSGIMMFNQKA
ncbi:MAG: hypothetical protein H7A40_06595 [Chlamydiales bacterium]|nr:hypothetical protein [Chlamydiales bacterium]